MILVNGRISNKSFKRWQQFDYISKELLGCFTFCLGQSEEDAYRLRVLGARDSMCLGNLKYAGLQPPIDAAKRDEIAAQIGSRPLWNVSSTHRDEEVKIGKFLKRVQEKVPGLLTIMAPRHPNRGPEIQQDLDNLGLTTALRSKGEPITAQTDVYIADTIGEVGIWYDLAPLVFIGGSLIPHGGQNFMEPSRMRDAVIVGPHMFNFTDAMNRAKKADAVIQVNDVLELEEAVLQLLTHKELLEAKRSLAYNWAHGEARVLDGILEKSKDTFRNENARFLVRTQFPFPPAETAGCSLCFCHPSAHRAGTPVQNRTACRLHRQSDRRRHGQNAGCRCGCRTFATGRQNPFFVSRGYGGTLKNIMVDKERHTASEVGDEPLLLARRAPVIVNPDRVAGAQKALRSGAEVIVMDDGFQNPGLYKDLSFLVFDGGFGIGNGLSVPAGPLRENFAAGLKRAHAAIILGEDKHNLSAKIAGIPIFRGSVVPVRPEVSDTDAVAFAGIGRPENFMPPCANSASTWLKPLTFRIITVIRQPN